MASSPHRDTNTAETHIAQASELIARQLRVPWDFKKAPYGFDLALANASNSPASHTAHIFLESSFQAFFAYHIATKAKGLRYPGHTIDTQTMDLLEELGPEQRALVADEVTSTVPHATVTTGLEHLRSRKRLRELNVQAGTRKRHYEPTCSPASDQTQFLSVSASMALADDDGSQDFERFAGESLLPLHGHVLTSTDEQQTLSNPAARRLVDIFPPYLCSAVSRTASCTASVTMDFPSTFQLSSSKVECLMSVSILPNKVQYLAMEMFGVHVESEAGQQHILLEDGVKILITDEVRFQGSKEEAIEKLLGSQISLAIKRSPARQEEIRQGARGTYCVTLSMPGQSDRESLLNICLGLDEAFQVKEKLFK